MTAHSPRNLPPPATATDRGSSPAWARREADAEPNCNVVTCRQLAIARRKSYQAHATFADHGGGRRAADGAGAELA